MSNMKLVIEFTSAEELQRQLGALLKLGMTGANRTASGIATLVDPVGKNGTAGNPRETEPSKQETAKPVVEVKDEKDKPAETSVEKKSEEAKPEEKPEETSGITKENLKTVPYEELLAFCEAHPEVGINPEKVKQTIMRGLVELKVGNYLDAQ